MDINPVMFTLIRKVDQSGISGTGRVLDGVIFHTGQVVICWRSDLNFSDQKAMGYSTLGIYPSYDAFLHVHVNCHPEGVNEVVFLPSGKLECL